MKTRLILLLISLSIYNISSSQINENYLNYYKKINQAELAIVDSAYKNALICYQQAFSLVGLPMSKDLHNASVCATKVKKFNDAFHFFDKLVQKGVKMDYFKSEIFKPLRKTKEWAQFEKEYPEKYKQAIAKHNLEFKSILNQMQGNDQELAKKKNEDQNLRPQFHAVVKKNEKEFVKLIEKYGFPSEDLIGIDEPCENIAMILLIHFMQVRSFEGGGLIELNHDLKKQ